MLNKLKSEKGITGIDLTISIIIIMMFVSIIAAASMNISSSLTSKRRIEIVTDFMTEAMENLDSMEYDKIYISKTKDENNISNVKELEDINDTDNKYNFEKELINILNNNENYNILTVGVVKEAYVPSDYVPENEGDTPPDLIKKITLEIKYKINNNDETISVTRLKTRYNVDL